LKGTPGVLTAGHSLNTATLARQAKAHKLAAQVAANNRLQLQAAGPNTRQPAVVATNNAAAAAGTGRQTSAPLARVPGGGLPREYIIASGCVLDLRAQHRVSETGFRTLATLIEYTATRARDPQAAQRMLQEQGGSFGEFGEHAGGSGQDGFTEEQRARLAAVGVSAEMRALVTRSASASSSSSSVGVPATAAPYLSLSSIVTRLGIWRAVNLIQLDVSFTGISSGALACLARQAPNLLKVSLSGCQALTNEGIVSLARHCRSLQVLLMEVLPALDDRAVQEVAHECRQLLALDVGSCRRITNVSFQILAKHGRQLKRLSAAGCSQLSDYDVEDISRCVSLLSLSLRACSKITDASVEALVLLSKRKRKAGMRGLQRLDLGGCARISDGGVNALCAAYADSLTHLDLRGLSRLTGRTLDAIQAHCRSTLTHLNVAECAGITAERLQAMREAWPQLDISS